MSYSKFDKVFTQLQAKPAIWEKYVKHNKPKELTGGRAKKRCRRCGRIRGHIAKYGLNLCRQCFRNIALKLGFKKFS